MDVGLHTDISSIEKQGNFMIQPVPPTSQTNIHTNTHLRIKSPIQLELTSGTFFIVRADALTTKSFTDSLYSPFARSFKLLRSLENEERETNGRDAKMLK